MKYEPRENQRYNNRAQPACPGPEDVADQLFCLVLIDCHLVEPNVNSRDCIELNVTPLAAKQQRSLHVIEANWMDAISWILLSVRARRLDKKAESLNGDIIAWASGALRTWARSLNEM